MRRGRWHGTAVMLLALAAGALPASSGCTHGFYHIYPSPAHVPHPDQPSPAMSLDQLEELYMTSPATDPDGSGHSGLLGLNSNMRLLTQETQRRREDFKQQSYSRTAAEQREALEAMNQIFKAYVVFEGMLVSSVEDFVDIRRYLPEGVFLLDDRGNKFLPVETTMGFRLRPRGEISTASAPYRRVDSQLGPTWWAHPTLVFPRQAIGPETRAVSLYLARPYARVRFTWVFDPTYAAPRPERAPADYRSGMEQLFRNP